MLTLSPTAVLAYEDCPRAYHYRYVLKARRAIASANLAFGDVVDGVIETYLRAVLNGQPVDPAALFTERWTLRTAQTALEYASQWTPAQLRATGQTLLARFPAVWSAGGWMPLVDAHGEPLLQRRLEAPVAPGVTLRGRLDAVVLDRDLRVAVVDFKTTAQAREGFGHQADQLTAYQLLVEAHAAAWGIGPLDLVGFMDLIKRVVPATGKGQGPTVTPPVLGPVRAPDVLADYRCKLQWIAEDIARGRFPKRTRMAHNSPCGLCDYRLHCWDGKDPDLIFPAPAPAAG